MFGPLWLGISGGTNWITRIVGNPLGGYIILILTRGAIYNKDLEYLGNYP